MERLVFAGSVETLYLHGLKGKVTPELRAALREAGVDLDRMLPAYPVAVWHRALERTSALLYPGLSPAEAQRQLGALTVSAMESSLMGQAMVAMARLVGPRRALLRLPHNARTGSNYTEFSARELGPTSVELEVRQFDGAPEFLEGVLQATVRLCGGREPRVEVAEADRPGERYRFRVGWAA